MFQVVYYSLLDYDYNLNIYMSNKRIMAILVKIQALITALEKRLLNKQTVTSQGIKLNAVSTSYLGKDVTPLDRVDDDVACASSVSTLLAKIMDFPHITGTWTMMHKFETDSRFQETGYRPEEGLIVIAATGTGNRSMRGHVGILGSDGYIRANVSSSGKWQISYSVKQWYERYGNKGGFPVRWFRIV